MGPLRSAVITAARRQHVQNGRFWHSPPG